MASPALQRTRSVKSSAQLPTSLKFLSKENLKTKNGRLKVQCCAELEQLAIFGFPLPFYFIKVQA
jgi:hypothetical protein